MEIYIFGLGVFVICLVIASVFFVNQEETKKYNDIDEALRLGFNWSMGPFEMLENIGLDNFFNKVGNVVEINNEKLSSNFWATSAMMAPFYELLNILSSWLVSKGVRKDKAQKYITSLFVALSEDAVLNSKKDLKLSLIHI